MIYPFPSPGQAPGANFDDLPVRLDLPGGRTIIAGGVSDLPAGRTFHKSVHWEHFLKEPYSIGLSLAIVKKLQLLGVTRLLVRNLDNGLEYRTAFETFLHNSFTQHRRGAEDIQCFLPVKHWTVSIPEVPAETPAPNPQLSLFVEAGS